MNKPSLTLSLQLRSDCLVYAILARQRISKRVAYSAKWDGVRTSGVHLGPGHTHDPTRLPAYFVFNMTYLDCENCQ